MREEVPGTQDRTPGKGNRSEWGNSRGGNHETIQEIRQDLSPRSLGQQAENPSRAMDLGWDQGPSRRKLWF